MSQHHLEAVDAPHSFVGTEKYRLLCDPACHTNSMSHESAPATVYGTQIYGECGRGSIQDMTHQNPQHSNFNNHHVTSHVYNMNHGPTLACNYSPASVATTASIGSCDTRCSLESELAEAQRKNAQLAQRLQQTETENQQMRQYFQQYQPCLPEPSHVSESEYVQQCAEYAALEHDNRALHARREALEQQKLHTAVSGNRDLEMQQQRNTIASARRLDLEESKRQLEASVRKLNQNLRRTQQNRGNRMRKRRAKRAPKSSSEASAIRNLIRAQAEFYFSEHHLRRNKKLLDRIVDGRNGFLPVQDVLELPRIKPLATPRKHFLAAIKSSHVLSLTADDWVGCVNFQPPKEKEFPFRRTVFIYGLESKDKAVVEELLGPYGEVLRVEFGDDAEDSFDFQVAKQMSQAPYVSTLMPCDSLPLVSRDRSATFSCSCSDSASLCLQCAALQAETQIQAFKDAAENVAIESGEYQALRKHWLGQSSGSIGISRKYTALAVFQSQRQASKCVFVRSRLPWNGVLCAHYHHYARMKKEIALSAPYLCEKDSHSHTSKSTPPSNVACESSIASSAPSLVEDCDSECTGTTSSDFTKQDDCSVGLQHGFCHDSKRFHEPEFVRVMNAPVSSKQQVRIRR